MYIILIYGYVLFELMGKLTLEAASSPPFQTQECLSQRVLHGPFIHRWASLPPSLTGREEKHE